MSAIAEIIIDRRAIECLFLLLVPPAVISFVAAAFIRSTTNCIITGAAAAELLVFIYLLVRAASSPQGVDVRFFHGTIIGAIFGAPVFLLVSTGFTFLARWVFRQEIKW